MYINHNYSNNQPSFQCIRIKDGGIHLLKKEGTYALNKVEQAKDEFRKYNWHLNIDSENYSLTSPTTKKTYFGPFSIKRHIKKNKNTPDEFQIIVRMSDNNMAKYAINFDNMQEVQNVYKAIKNSKGIDKMINILQILEKGFNVKLLRQKIARINKLSNAQIQE